MPEGGLSGDVVYLGSFDYLAKVKYSYDFTQPEF
jgi:hypothetical protein